MKILLLEDERKIRTLLTRALKSELFEVLEAKDAKEAQYHIDYSDFDIAIFDRMVPGVNDSTELVANMRNNKNSTPVLFLTAKDSVDQKVEGLDVGADDYLVKPFSIDELLARIRALLRRPTEQNSEVLSCGEIELDSKNFVVTRKNKTVEITRKEFVMLEYLLRNKNIVLTKQQIISNVWESEADVMPNTVEAFIKSLRSKLEKPFKGKRYIHTQRGFGYMMKEE
jgi:two-component system copper resistance phosphate regulon response regulator CusR